MTNEELNTALERLAQVSDDADRAANKLYGISEHDIEDHAEALDFGVRGFTLALRERDELRTVVAELRARLREE